MQVTVYVNNLTFVSKAEFETTAQKAKELIYSQIQTINKLEMELENGGFLVLGQKAFQNAVLVFND